MSREDDDVVGKFAENLDNDNGKRLIEICKQYGLKLTNTYFQHKDIHRYTWERPSLGQKSIIDYIIVKQRTNFRTHDVRVRRGANCGTDHHLLAATVVYPYVTEHKTTQVQGNLTNTTKLIRKQYNLHLLQQASIQDLYQTRLSKELNGQTFGTNVEEEYLIIKNIIHKISREVLGECVRTKSKKQPHWFTEDIKHLVEEKNRLHKKYLSTKSNDDRENYKRLNKNVRKQIKEEKNKMWENRCTQINTYIGGARSTEVWKTIKGIKTNNKNQPASLIDMNTWMDYYGNLLAETREEFLEDEYEIVDVDAPQPISIDELRQCVSEMKNGRSPGPGQITAELIKYGGKALSERIKDLMNLCLRQGKTPMEWKECYISSLYKKGDKKNPENYRGLSVACTFSRLWGKVIQKRLRMEIEHHIGEDQSGFTPGRSCTDNLFTLQQLIEKKIGKGDEVHITFIDLKKAYDNVPRIKLWRTLETIGVRPSTIRTIRELYENNTSYVKKGDYLSAPIYPSKGLRQGCSISPLLFNIYIEIALRNWKQRCEGMGIPINDSYLYTLSFADDQAILAQDSYDMEFMLRRLYTEYQHWGLDVSLEKTEYLIVNSEAKFDVLINDNAQIKQVDVFKYLGAMIDKHGIGSREISDRIQNARRIVGALNSLWWDKNIRKDNKKRIGQVMVETVLCYGSEVWTLREEDKRRLTAVEMDYLRRSAGISRMQRVRNEQIRELMSANESVIQRIEKRSLKWFGHLLRMPDTRWPKKVFKWKPPGKNKRGRPRKSWSGGVQQAMTDRNLREEMAYDREAWRLGVGMRHLAV